MAIADLRPMTLGEVLDHTFSLYKRHFWLFVGIMSWPSLVLFCFNVLMGALGKSGFGSGRVASPTHTAVSPALIGGAIGAGLLAFVVYLALVGAAQAAAVFAVSDLYLGRTPTIASSFRQMRGNIGRVLGVMFVAGIIIVVGFILLIVPGIILMCRTGLAVPAAMLEDKGPRDSVSRSMELTKGYAMQMFLIILLVWVLAFVSAGLIQFPFSLLVASSKPQAVSFGLLLLQNVATLVSQVLVGPIATIAFCLMYYNLRVRKEGFDLQHLMGSLGPSSNPASSTSGTVSPA